MVFGILENGNVISRMELAWLLIILDKLSTKGVSWMVCYKGMVFSTIKVCNNYRNWIQKIYERHKSIKYVKKGISKMASWSDLAWWLFHLGKSLLENFKTICHMDKVCFILSKLPKESGTKECLFRTIQINERF